MFRAVLGLSMCLILIPAVARGQGFGIYEQGACAQGRGGAAVAEPCNDGSSIYVNPAGLAGRTDIVIAGGATPIFGTGSFTGNAGGTTNTEMTKAAPPHAYFQYPFRRVVLGAGLYVPYGLGVKWPLSFGGRFVSYDSHLTTVYIQPTVAYAVNSHLSVGGGLTVAVGSVDLKRRADLASVPLGLPGLPLTFGALVDPQTDFANTALSASKATGVGANLGVLVTANDRFRIGARYLSKVTLNYEGTATFAPVPGTFRVTKINPLGLPVGAPLDAQVSQVLATLQNQSAKTEIPMPAQFVVGAAVHATDRLKLFFDYQWVGWSAFKTVTLDFSNPIPPDENLVQNYRDTSDERLGAELSLRPTVRLRGGYFHSQAAAPDETVTPILPEAARNHFTGGVGWDVTPHVTLDFAYQFIAHDDRQGRIVNPPPGVLPTVALNSGVYRERGDLLGITMTYRR